MGEIIVGFVCWCLLHQQTTFTFTFRVNKSLGNFQLFFFISQTQNPFTLCNKQLDKLWLEIRFLWLNITFANRYTITNRLKKSTARKNVEPQWLTVLTSQAKTFGRFKHLKKSQKVKRLSSNYREKKHKQLLLVIKIPQLHPIINYSNGLWTHLPKPEWLSI